MDRLIEWIKGIGYDLFSILLPGILFLFGIDKIIGSMPSVKIPLLSLELGKITGLDSHAANGIVGITVFTLIFFTVAYLIGVTLKLISGKKWFTNFFTNNQKLKQYNASPEVYKMAEDKISSIWKLKKSGVKCNWPTFYMIVKLYLQENKVPTSIFEYQNKYEFCRTTSMAAFFLGLFDIIFVSACCLRYNHPFENQFWVTNIAILISSIVLFLVLRSGFQKNWTLVGDHVIFQALNINAIKLSNKHDQKSG